VVEEVKPDVPVALQKLSMTLLVEIAPQIGVEYLQRNSAISAIMLQMAAEEFDRAAARLVEENGAVRALFGNASPGVTDGALRERLERASGGGDPDLRISALSRTNQDLRALLIELHTHVEERSDAVAKRIEEAIWAELRRSTERRAFPLSPF
jgi:hypothetical protein